ncbi:unnamed protein product [Prorocentrum cordatum]|uniref:CSN8/PSMD8/EIF3K domain-containing protein n=1 Tax=Prorocentrum cordatum TaxID=2364126 RepID=A0ABN9X5C5_9DINO|nr:unnamed protein product [Polarella glacialis]
MLWKAGPSARTEPNNQPPPAPAKAISQERAQGAQACLTRRRAHEVTIIYQYFEMIYKDQRRYRHLRCSVMLTAIVRMVSLAHLVMITLIVHWFSVLSFVDFFLLKKAGHAPCAPSADIPAGDETEARAVIIFRPLVETKAFSNKSPSCVIRRSLLLRPLSRERLLPTLLFSQSDSSAAAGGRIRGTSMEGLWQLLAAGDFEALAPACEEAELAVPAEVAEPTAEQTEQLGLRYAAQMLAYLLRGDLIAGRFLWKRTPPAVQQQPQPAAAHEALAARWARRHADYFRRLEAGPWDARLQPLVAEAAKRGRAELLDKIGEAYKVIGMDRVAGLLGLDVPAALAACASRGWAADAEGRALPAPRKRSPEELMQMGDAQLHQLAQYVAYLEQPQSLPG